MPSPAACESDGAAMALSPRRRLPDHLAQNGRRRGVSQVEVAPLKLKTLPA
jgi:hypothetical protein